MPEQDLTATLYQNLGTRVQGKTKTVTIQIGNTDDKLSQARWSAFVTYIQNEIQGNVAVWKIHFAGGSSNWLPWQNYAWVLEIFEHYSPILKAYLVDAREEFGQDSIAWTEGETLFV